MLNNSRSTVLWLIVAIAICCSVSWIANGSEQRRTLKTFTVIRRIGLSDGYAKFGGVSKPILSADKSQSNTLEVHNLPASKVFFAAALSDKNPSSTQLPIFCTIYFSQDDTSESSLVHFELSADESGWHEAVADIPAIRAGELRFESRSQDSETTAVRWAQPIAVPLNTKSSEPLIVLISLDTLRSDHVSGFSGDSLLSPALAKIGEKGLRHLVTTSEGTWTLPSHYSLLFSRMYGFPIDKKPLRSLAQTLAENGFVTVGLTGGGFVGAAFNFHLDFDH